jgi:hypothetical protein
MKPKKAVVGICSVSIALIFTALAFQPAVASDRAGCEPMGSVITNGGFENGFSGWEKYNNSEITTVHSGKRAIYFNSSREPTLDHAYVWQCQTSVPEESLFRYYIYPEYLSDTDGQCVELIKNWVPSTGYGDVVAEIYIYKSHLTACAWAKGGAQFYTFPYSMPWGSWHKVELYLQPSVLKQRLVIDDVFFGNLTGTQHYAPEVVICGDVSSANSAGSAYYDDIYLSGGSGNQIQNGGFEDTGIAPWQPCPSMAYYFSRYSFVRSGNMAYYNGRDISHNAYIYQSIPPLGEKYYLTVWMYPQELNFLDPQDIVLAKNWDFVSETGDYVARMEIYKNQICFFSWKPSGTILGDNISYSLPLSVWHRFDISIDTANKTQKIYIDSSIFYNSTLSSGSTFYPDKLIIGDLSVVWYSGVFYYDDIALYNNSAVPELPSAFIFACVAAAFLLTGMFTATTRNGMGGKNVNEIAEPKKDLCFTK